MSLKNFFTYELIVLLALAFLFTAPSTLSAAPAWKEKEERPESGGGRGKAKKNRPPSIEGVPDTEVYVNSNYDFRPTAGDPEGDVLSFTINVRPSWATFDVQTGRLFGFVPDTAADDVTQNIVIGVSDGVNSRSLAPFSISVLPLPSANNAPSITGDAANDVLVNEFYSFTPSASDPDEDELSFTVLNLPEWANFSSSTGTINGSPSDGDVGYYGEIVISVRDSESTVSLAAFSIEVVSLANGGVTLNWEPPTENTDSSYLTDLSGYNIYYGKDYGDLTNVIQLPNPGLSAYVVENLSSGTWYFGITAYNSLSAESDVSSVVSMIIN